MLSPISSSILDTAFTFPFQDEEDLPTSDSTVTQISEPTPEQLKVILSRICGRPWKISDEETEFLMIAEQIFSQEAIDQAFLDAIFTCHVRFAENSSWHRAK